MTKKLSSFMGVGLLLIIVLTACQSTPIEPTVDLQGLVSTSVALTLQAHSSNPTANPLPTSQFPTTTLLPSGTPIPTLQTLPTYQPPVPTKAPCLHMNITDITIPDNTKFSPSTAFTKTWRLYNDGSCTWSKSFVAFFFGGDQMGAPATVALSKDVLSGSSVDISVNMVAPSVEATYKGNWKMKAQDGTVFGSGNSSVPFFVQIIVQKVPFAVTNVVISVDDASPAPKPCGDSQSITFRADITVTAPGDVTYKWKNPEGVDGSIEPPLNFTGAGTQRVTMFWTLTANATGSVSVYIDNPNHQWFGPGGDFEYTCP